MANLAAYQTVAPSGSEAYWKIAATTSPVLIFSSSQEERAHGSVFNNSAASLYLKFGSVNGLSVTGIYSVKLTSGSYYEMPKPPYQGQVWGVWDATGGWAMVTELGDND